MDTTKLPDFEKTSDVAVEFRKNLDDNTVFKFECIYLQEQEKILLKATEINVYTPFYYEYLYDKEEIYNIGKMFKSCGELSEMPRHIKKLFSSDEAKLSLSEDSEDLSVILNPWDISEKVEIKFNLRKNTVENKDEALKYLYIMIKNNNKILNNIKEI